MFLCRQSSLIRPNRGWVSSRRTVSTPTLPIVTRWLVQGRKIRALLAPPGVPLGRDPGRVLSRRPGRQLEFYSRQTFQREMSHLADLRFRVSEHGEKRRDYVPALQLLQPQDGILPVEGAPGMESLKKDLVRSRVAEDSQRTQDIAAEFGRGRRNQLEQGRKESCVAFFGKKQHGVSAQGDVNRAAGILTRRKPAGRDFRNRFPSLRRAQAGKTVERLPPVPALLAGGRAGHGFESLEQERWGERGDYQDRFGQRGSGPLVECLEHGPEDFFELRVGRRQDVQGKLAQGHRVSGGPLAGLPAQDLEIGRAHV